jgi:hypothetical protein
MATRTRPKRLLVLANEAVGGNRLVEEILKRAGDPGNAEAMIVSPALVSSRVRLAVGDLDDAIAGARQRLQISVSALERAGIPARGEVGEAEPDLALHDAYVKFPADEVIVVAHEDEHASWLEKDLQEKVRRELSIPITYIEVAPRAAAPVVAEVKDVAPAAQQTAAAERAEERSTYYLPPLSARDRFALALGPLGTLALWLLASSCRGELAQDFSGDAGCVTIMVLALFGVVVTAIHVPALLLLRSGRYTSKGLADFMSLFMFVYFVPALAAAFVIAIAT